MTSQLRARFDGKVLVPEQPVDLPTDRPLDVLVTLAPIEAPTAKSQAEIDAAWQRLLRRAVPGTNIPDSALTSEGLYD